MGIPTATRGLNDFDMDKMMDVVDLVWNNREKLSKTLDNVWDNWDDVMDAVNVVMANREHFLTILDFMRDNRDRLLRLVDDLPGLLHKAGDGIEAAGSSAIQASRFLVGGSDDDSTSASELMNLAAGALLGCRRELGKAAQIMEALGDEVDDIRIPQIVPKFVEVMGMRVVGGVDFGESKLMDNAAARLKGGSARLVQIGDEFEQVAAQMRHLGNQLTAAGGDLGTVGDRLRTSGDMLRSLSLMGDTAAPAAGSAVGAGKPLSSLKDEPKPAAGGKPPKKAGRSASGKTLSSLKSSSTSDRDATTGKSPRK